MDILARKRQERARSSWLAAGCRRKVRVDEPLTPPDRIAPIGTGGTPITGNASEVSIGVAAFTLRLSAVHPCSCRRCCIRSFTTASSLTGSLLRQSGKPMSQQSTSRDSDVPPSCVADISQTRPTGTGQCHSFMNAYQRRLSDIVQYRCSIVWL